MLLCYLHRVTGEEQWLDAAKRAADSLVKAQNPNASWPHHWMLEAQVGVSARGPVHLGV